MSNLGYQEFFGLKAPPFSIAPDPHYLYMSRQHQEALAHLYYGVQSAGGFVLLTGEVGTGKTTVCRSLLRLLDGQVKVAFIYDPMLSARELLRAVCVEFGVALPPGPLSTRYLVDVLNRYLLKAYAAGLNPVLIIDEAQNLSAKVLEQLRLLTNLETNERKLLQVVLLGQPELRRMLKRPELRQLAQRVFTRFHLGPLSPSEVAAYVHHRLWVAGAPRSLMFPDRVLRQLYRLSKGVPRVINLLCDRALLGASVRRTQTVDVTTLKAAALDVFGSEPRRSARRWIPLGVAALAGGCSVLALAFGHVRPAGEAAKPAVHGAAAAAVAAVQAPMVQAVSLSPAGAAAQAGPTASAETAFGALLDGWQGPPAARRPCSDPASRLRCWYRRGGLQEIKALNMPVVLVLQRGDGSVFQALVTNIEGERVSLRAGDAERTVDAADLAGRWGGSYFVLWNPPPGYAADVKPGQSSAVIPSLRRQLAIVQRQPDGREADPVFDAELAGRLRSFQLAEGLAPDGILGPEAWIRLSARSGYWQPTLASTLPPSGIQSW